MSTVLSDVCAACGIASREALRWMSSGLCRRLVMVRMLGFVFGFAFLLGGALGFVPGVTKDGMYFGIFMVNTPHNILHIVSGMMFLTASILGERFARLWFQAF